MSDYKYDLTILVPAIRQPLWKRFYDSACKACKNYSFEVLFASPFDLPKELENISNIRLYKSYSNVPITMQKATKTIESDLLWHSVDDEIMFEDSLDKCFEYFYDNCTDKDVVNCRYREHANFTSPEFPLYYWKVKNNPELQLKGIDKEWEISLQPLMKTNLFKSLGGFRCNLGINYSNHLHMDLIFRIQMNGGKIYHSPVEVGNADHYPGRSFDHAEIHDCQIYNDLPIFSRIWDRLDNPIVVDYDNYLEIDRDWTERFDFKYKSYNEMVIKKGYVK
ncbi:MAG: hypothetical protein AABY22_24920 [Nanoarchaeota archaeon]